MAKKILLATNNPAKVNELSLFLKDIPVQLVTLKEVGITDQAPEDGRTFIENALSKAQFYMEKSGLPALADDGGVEIDAFNGEPGVDSHRWISKTHDDSDNDLINYTIERMKDIPLEQRGGQMTVVLAFLTPEGKKYTTEGIIRGIIAEKDSGMRTKGFPFRSLFYIPEIEKYYDHELLTKEETERYNHRKQAMERMKPYIQDWLNNN